jgi:hypothetical protein
MAASMTATSDMAASNIKGILDFRCFVCLRLKGLIVAWISCLRVYPCFLGALTTILAAL